METFENDFEKAEYIQNILISHATGGEADNIDYQELRGYFLENPLTKPLLPSWVRTNRNLSQFWQFIKSKFSTYAERRTFIWDEFSPLLDFLEEGLKIPGDQVVTEALNRFNAENVLMNWTKALERRKSDPERAITAARSLLESLCKYILDEKNLEYSKNADLSQLYHSVSIELNLSPSQYTEDVFKQILGGCSSIVNGLGTLRNSLGDSHGKGKTNIRSASRHAQLAVNLAGSLALFIVETWEYLNQNSK
jgi:hypothetical protein